MSQNKIIDLMNLFENDPDFITKIQGNGIILFTKFRAPLAFPLKINLSGNVLKSIYLIFGDGYYKSKLNLTNKNYRIHSFVLGSLEEEMKIKRSVWRLRILHSDNSSEVLSKVKSYWLSALGFNESQLYPKISPEILKTGIQGIARIQIDKLTYGDVISRIIEYVNVLISSGTLSKEEYCIITDSILNAEGSVLLDSDGIHRITISFNKSEKELFKTILIKLIPENILVEKDDRFTISRWKNIYQFLKAFAELDITPFSLRPQDAFNLSFGFLNHRRTKALKNYLETILKNPRKPFRKIAKLSNRDWKSAKMTLQIRTKEFIQIEKVRNKHLTSISKEGKTLLRVIRKLENWLPILKKMIEEDQLLLKQLKEVN